MVTRKYEGISYSESSLSPDRLDGPELRGIRLVYTADQKKDGETVSAVSDGHGSSGLVIPFDMWTFDELAARTGMNAKDCAAFASADDLAVQCGGWLSWSPGWELAGNESLPRRILLLPLLRRLTNREGDDLAPEIPLPLDAEAPPELPAKGWISGHFIIYLRAGNRYLCIASREGGALPPVSFRIHRAARVIIILRKPPAMPGRLEKATPCRACSERRKAKCL